MEHNLQKKNPTNPYAVHLKLTQYCKSIILQSKKKNETYIEGKWAEEPQ